MIAYKRLARSGDFSLDKHAEQRLHKHSASILFDPLRIFTFQQIVDPTDILYQPMRVIGTGIL
jgi:hypothetical protein